MAVFRRVELGSSESNSSSVHQQIPCGPGWRGRYSDLLRVSRSRNRIPVNVFFLTAVQTSREAHLAFCTMHAWSLCQG